ncbi:ArnT family glycosyltransferase [Amycolatopsis umgeniensis]|uniref:4-amino-4-deoxy-L-arabinose transferase-like glycosyltransferase n=1 Tax=Amycolatopsis umgeniensis TaxID=336628 RepID=A0A841AT12_9PSEU|nr:glycosyltransferase family 39 protein [Amycolatopsis umgeniensis]MBB5851026.1 4-amino-4-deoxy-L-arabinose transferase-like glycosyltransferase [Amycolatopsis umgeniensis]
MTTSLSTAVDTPAEVPARSPGRGHRLVLAAILLVSTAWYGWGIWELGYGYPYYSAAVESMSGSWTGFLFGSVDPLGVVTVDKPPMGLWIQVLSVQALGFHGWALILPQVLEGVATVWVLFLTVRRWQGERVALLAAALFSCTPIVVAVIRDNMPDPLLFLLLVSAAYAVTRAIDDPGRERRWMLLAAVFLGCAFTTKMVQAWLVLPALALAYLVGSSSGVRAKALTTALATGVLAVTSFWWVVVVDLWPGPKPYIGSSADGSARDLVFGYNGLGRIVGQDFAAAASYAEEHGKSFYQSDPGAGRLLGTSLGGQAGWLLPLALAAVLAGVVLVVLGRRPPRRTVAGWVLWGGWLLVCVAVFSFMRGIWLLYYTAELAPAIAALSAAALAALWRQYRAEGRWWPLLPTVIAGLGFWAWLLVNRAPEWNGWTGIVVAAATALAVGLLVLAKLGPRRAAVPGFVIGLVAISAAPVAWSTATGVGYSAGLPMLPAAGPVSLQTDYLEPAVRDDLRGLLGGWGARDFRASAGTLDETGKALLGYVERESGDTRVTLAVETADTAAPFIMATDRAVIGMAGFTNRDPAPSPDRLREWIERGEVAHVLLLPEEKGQYEFVRTTCTSVPPAAYGAEEGPGDLYRCRL